MNEQLSNYIQQQTTLGVPKETIIQNLKAGGGWSEEEIQNVFTPLNIPQDNRIYGKVSLILTSIVYLAIIIIVGTFIYKNSVSRSSDPILFLLVPIVVLLLFFVQQIFLFKKNKINSQLNFALIPFCTIGSISVLSFNRLGSAVLLLPGIFFIVLLVCILMRSDKKSTFKLKIIFQIVLSILIISSWFYYKIRVASIQQTSGGAIPCVTGVYNPATKLCE
jgi:hypothetical protein